MPSIIEDKVITDPKLREVFEKYALHGNRTSLMTTPASTPMKKTETQLDGMRFAKLIREANLLDNKLISSVDVDIIFAKVKPKTERKIKFDDFVKAVKLIGEKKFGPDGFELAQNAIIRIGYPCLSPGKKVAQQIISEKVDESHLVESHAQESESRLVESKTEELEPSLVVDGVEELSL